MSKTRMLLLLATVVVGLGIGGVAEACPPCSQPWLWTGRPCLPTNCSLCGWEVICGGGGSLPRQTPLAPVEEPNAMAACAAADETTVPAEVSVPQSDAPAPAGDTH